MTAAPLAPGGEDGTAAPARGAVVPRVRRLAAAGLLLIAGGCGASILHTPPPADIHGQAVVLGRPDIRFWADRAPPDMQAALEQRVDEINRQYGDEIAAGRPIQIDLLALSGGGSDGAFGAGLLNGWTEHGDRPTFDVVTGISTGALIAPFAFLGPEWDDKLREVYTTTRTEDLLLVGALNLLTGLLGGPSVGDARPFQAVVARYADDELVARVGEEHRKGRRLFVGTTTLDAGRPVVWDLGAIAAMGTPEATELFRNILVASASIPGVFPPVSIPVEIDGARYDELHADGGVSSQVFAYPAQMSTRDLDRLLPVPIERTLYVVRNTQLQPEYVTVEPGVLNLTGRAISVLISYSGIGDLYRIFGGAQRDDVKFRLAAIPESFDRVPTEAFDIDYMNELYRLGYDLGRSGYRWRDGPPGLTGPSLRQIPAEELARAASGQ